MNWGLIIFQGQKKYIGVLPWISIGVGIGMLRLVSRVELMSVSLLKRRRGKSATHIVDRIEQ